MRIGMFSAQSVQYRALAELTWNQNKRLYCERHGFLGCNKEFETFSYPRYWPFKFEKIKSMFVDQSCDWVWITGCDSMVTDFTNDLSEIITKAEKDNCHFVVATDRNGLNADSCLLKGDMVGIDMLHWILNKKGQYIDDQAVINAYVREYGEGCMFVPQRTLNSYNYNLYPHPDDRYDKLGTNGQWQYGDLLIHWPGFTDHPHYRITWAKEWMKKIKHN